MDFDLKPPAVEELAFADNVVDAMTENPVLGRKLASLARNLHQLRLDARDTQSILLPYYTDRGSGFYKAGTASFLADSRKALEDEETPAGALLVAARNVLGPGIGAWEPDTLHVELDSREKLNVPLVNYDKLLAGLTLLETPMFYFEANTFKNTGCAFNDVHFDPEVVEELSPAQLCWAVYEAELILQEHMLYEPDFDHEPITYTALSLHRSGFVLAPTILNFAQEALDKLNQSKGLKEKVQEEWAKISKSPIPSRTFAETAVDAQLARLTACQLYLEERADKYQAALNNLTHAAPISSSGD